MISIDFYIKEMITFYIFISIGSFVFRFKHTYFHELGHILKCRKFNKSSKIGMVLNKKIIRKKKIGISKCINPLKKIIGYEVYNNKFVKNITKQYEKTYTEKDFTEFNLEELEEIAEFGVIFQTIFGIVWACLLSLIYFILFHNLILTFFVLVWELPTKLVNNSPYSVCLLGNIMLSLDYQYML